MLQRLLTKAIFLIVRRREWKDMKLMKVISIFAMTVVFTLIGWKLFETWLLSLPLDHPYLRKPHTIESLLAIPLIAFGISLIIYYAALKPLFNRF